MLQPRVVAAVAAGSGATPRQYAAAAPEDRASPAPFNIQAQVITNDGEAITGGAATIVMDRRGNHKTWEPKSNNGNWISPQMTFTAPVGAHVEVLMVGHIFTPDDPFPSGSSIDEPRLDFTA